MVELNTWGRHPRRTKTRNLVLGGISLFVAATLVGTVLGWLTADPANAGFARIKSSTPAAPSTDPANLPEPTPIETPSLSVSTWTPSPTPSESIKAERERQAYNDLEQQADDDLQQTTLAGQWWRNCRRSMWVCVIRCSRRNQVPIGSSPSTYLPNTKTCAPDMAINLRSGCCEVKTSVPV